MGNRMAHMEPPKRGIVGEHWHLPTTSLPLLFLPHAASLSALMPPLAYRVSYKKKKKGKWEEIRVSAPPKRRAEVRSILIVQQGPNPLPSPNLSWRKFIRIQKWFSARSNHSWRFQRLNFFSVKDKSAANTPRRIDLGGSSFFSHLLHFYLLCSLPNQIWLPTVIAR